ncbi:MAG TPA: 2-hydroxychromene-2-carboxylate isomerase [Burkholderiales bacterium]|nr:2-hydroxychromene-2-carboxylate isomerase [Burkholderiales bacterium]
MSKIVDYYFSPISPWTYLGHARFTDIATRHGAVINVKPADFGKVFPVSGGLPVAKRAPQRQAYRMVELKRFRDYLKLPLNLQPKFFPVPADPAAQFIVAAGRAGGSDAAMRLAGAILRACWAEERNIADAETLAAICTEQGMNAAALAAAAQSDEVIAEYAGYTQEAIARNVFGAPSYVVDGEIFWGQDRLEFVERALAAK